MSTPGQTTQDLGLVAGIISSRTPPTNYKVLWYNEILQKPYFYDVGVDAWVQIGGSGGNVTDTFSVSLTNGKTMGAIKDGDIILAGTSINDLLKTALVEVKLPTYTTATLNLTVNTALTGEAGESFNTTVTATFDKGDAGVQKNLRINSDGLLLGSNVTTASTSTTLVAVRSLSGTTFVAYVSYAAGTAKTVLPANTLDARAPAVRNPNAPQAAENDFASNTIVIIGYRAYFYGPGATPVDRAGALLLGGFQTTNQGNGGTIDVGNTGLDFVILLPPGKTLTSVKHRELSNATITSSYVAQPTVSIKDPAGLYIAGYTPYKLHVTSQYGANNHHDFTYA